MSGPDDDLAGRLDEQGEIVRRHRDRQVELSERQAAVLARSAEIHDEVARVHEMLPERVLEVTPEDARASPGPRRAGPERSAEESRHAGAARARRTEEAGGTPP